MQHATTTTSGVPHMEERQRAEKVQSSAAEAISGIANGCSLAVGGFGLCGTPVDLIEAVRDSAVNGLTIYSNNCGSMMPD